MAKVYLSLGSNLGLRAENLKKARNLIDKKAGKIVVQSSLYESSPWGFDATNLFYNQIIVIESNKNPDLLLYIFKEIEQQLGRKTNSDPDKTYKSRRIDIDIIYYNDMIITNDKLSIPHPRMQHRLFVLVPLNEIAPDQFHPLFQKTTAELLENCKDQGQVSLIN